MSASGRGFRINEGDWTCPECSNVNFARRSQCNRCGVERKFETKKIKKGGIEIGKQAAEKSKGLFSADDWMCKTCGNVNWARRNDCNMCNTPKINVQEERTGYGGGFNEREGVEYKEKEDSDSEFDEFGRKKKKFRGQLTSAGGSTKEPADREEDSEDDDEDEGDASKYDLGADDDEDDEDDDTAKYDLEASDDDDKKSDRSKKSKSRSRSRSRSRNGRRSGSRSRSRSNSRSRRRRRSRSSSSSRDGRDHDRHTHKRRGSKHSRSRSRSPHHRRRSSSHDRHHRR